jgi:serine phosphatase RsbU (regulator of sigma subunit)
MTEKNEALNAINQLLDECIKEREELDQEIEHLRQTKRMLLVKKIITERSDVV